MINISIVSLFTVPSIGLALISYLIKISLSYGYFKRRGLKTPKYTFITGNLNELYKNQNESENVYKWTKQFGKTYGYYEGHSPVLVTSDLEIIKEVFVTQFNNFSARKKNPLEEDENRPVNHLMRSSKSRWKRMRKIMNPTFSSINLNMMNTSLNKCIVRLINKIKLNERNPIYLSNIFKRLTMDTIWNCTYGMDMEIQNNETNQYFKAGERVFSDAYKFKYVKYLSILFPELDSVWRFVSNLQNKLKKIYSSESDPKQLILNEFDEILKKRILLKQSNKKDYMQLLIESLSDNDELTRKYDNVDLNQIKISNIPKKITYNEIKANLKMFMLAGYESTSYVLMFSFFMLAINKNEKNILVEEINEYYDQECNNNNKIPDVKNVNDLKYLDMFCKEILRIYPISRVVRRCLNETNIKGIRMTPGLIVRIDHHAIHFDPELWGPVDPYEFYPLRHQDKRDQLCFLAFGAGPRICLGMKFALSQIKLVLVNLLRLYDINSTENTPNSLEFIEGILRTSKHDIPIVFTPRV